MIESIKQWLVEQKVILSQDEVALEARLCGNWSVLCYIRNELRYFIKLGTYQCVRQEYETLCAWHKKCPDLILKPLCLDRINQYTAYLQEAKVHQALTKKQFFKSDEVSDQLVAYFEASREACTDERYHLPKIDGVPKLFKCPQHGDLTLNNIGINNSKVYLFDWEDFNQCDFPLLDLMVLSMSLYDFHFESFVRGAQMHRKLNHWLKRILNLYQLDLDTFFILLPYGLQCFKAMKIQLGYDQSIIQRSDQARRRALDHQAKIQMLQKEAL